MNTICVTSEFKMLSEWRDVLGAHYYECLKEIFEQIYPISWDDNEYSAREIFCALIQYEGGVYGEQALTFIKDIYSICLD